MTEELSRARIASLKQQITTVEEKLAPIRTLASASDVELYREVKVFDRYGYSEPKTVTVRLKPEEAIELINDATEAAQPLEKELSELRRALGATALELLEAQEVVRS